MCDEVEQVAANAVLEDEPNVVLRLVPVVKLEHMWAIQLVQELHFIQDLVHAAFGGGLDSDVLHTSLPSRLIHKGVRASSDLIVDVVVFHRSHRVEVHWKL